MTVRAVLFDFSGTLFRFELVESWLEGITDDAGRPLDFQEQAEVMRRMTAPSGHVVRMGPEYEDAWERRDLDPQLHRKVYLEVLRLSGISDEHSRALYGRLLDPASWTPYPDTAEVLRRLHDADVPVAVLSNIAFDIRQVLDLHGLLDLVDDVLMSYVEGMIKPDPKLFLRACERVGAAPEETLMVGDSEEADGGAGEIGCKVAIVNPLPTEQRPDGLLTALAAHGL